MWRSKALIIASTVVVTALICTYTFIRSPRYSADATLLVVPEQIGQAAIMLMGKANPLDMQLGILSSESVEDETYRLIGGEDVNVAMVAKSDPDTNQIAITTSAASPALALKACESWIEAFANVSRNLNVSRTTAEADLLKESVERIRGELRAAEDQMLAYQKTMKIVPSSNMAETVGGYMSRYESLRQQLGAIEQKIATMKQSAGQVGSRGSDLPTGVVMLDSLRERYLSAEAELKRAEVVYGPEAPRVIGLRGERDVAKRLLDEESRKYAQSISSNVNRDIAGLEAERQALTYQLQQIRNVLPSVPSESAQITRLARRVGILSETLNQTEAAYEQARIKAEAERVRWSVLDKPSIANRGKPTNKNFLRYGVGGLLAGFLLGSMISVFLAWRRPL